MTAPSHELGVAVGRAIAPFFRMTSALRRARTFHPRGDLAAADVARHRELPGSDAALAALADHLSGRALVRLSSALARRTRWPDVLGCAIRFEIGQDILFATIKRPWTMPFSPFMTKVHDYFANDYFAVSPFVVDGGRRAYFRLRAEERDAMVGETSSARTSARSREPSRRALLAERIAHGTASFALEIAPGPRGPWRALATVRLVALLADDPAPLAFDPFRDGAGVRPIGFVHGLRRGVYAASRRARPT